MNVLITAPSLDENENVSGISTLVRSMIESSRHAFSHFEAGRRDGEASGAAWVLKQAMLPFRFAARIKKENPDIVHINTAFVPLAIVRDASLAAAARLFDRPVFLHIHGGPYVTQKISNAALEKVAVAMLKMAAVAVVFSEREAAALAKNFPGTKIRILPNGIPTANTDSAERLAGEKTIIFFGRLHRSKGLSYIVEACRVLREQGFKFRYSCYGAGPERQSFLTQMSALLGERFVFHGVARGVEKWRAFAAADIFFQPSRDEGLPIALLEAMASGCVPVMSDSGAVGDVIDDGVNGFIVEAGNTAQTVGRLKMLLSANRRDWDELRKNARDTVQSKFSFVGFLDVLDKIYDDIK